MSKTISNFRGENSKAIEFLPTLENLIQNTEGFQPSEVYQLLNFFGAIGIIFNTFQQKAWPALTLNIFWATIAIYNIYRFWGRKK